MSRQEIENHLGEIEINLKSNLTRDSYSKIGLVIKCEFMSWRQCDVWVDAVFGSLLFPERFTLYL